MKKIKIKWRVDPEPEGRYRSFYQRGWPSAEYPNENICAMIFCKDEYVPSKVKSGDHSSLTLRVADYRNKPWKWVTVKRRVRTVKEAKELLQKVLNQIPELMGDNLKEVDNG